MISKDKFPVIESALGFGLHDWQKDYILGKINDVKVDRGNGKTTAYMLWLIFLNDDPIHLYHRDIVRQVSDGVVREHLNVGRYNAWFFQELRRIYTLLADPKLELPVRKIYFTRGEYEQDRRR